jgi:hypothetical protein
LPATQAEKACGIAIHSFANIPVTGGSTIQGYFYKFKFLDGSIASYSTGGSVCFASLSGKDCKSCTLKKCTGGAFQPTIDCSNVQVGAKATACTKNVFGGFASLDTTAEKTTMVGLILPYFACGKKWATALAIPASSSVRSASPPSASPFSGIMEVDAETEFKAELDTLTAALSPSP